MAAHVLTTGFVHRLVGVSQVKHYVVVALIVTGRPVHVGVIVTVKAVRIEQSIEPISTPIAIGDRKSTRLNSSHVAISYAVFCLKKNIKSRTDKVARTPPKTINTTSTRPTQK